MPLDTTGLGRFDRRVLAAVSKIPHGQTASYRQIARRAGYPGACRAVGQAVGRNRWPMIIPCHRVIRSDGSLGGFGGGLTWKKRLLALEKTSASSS